MEQTHEKKKKTGKIIKWILLIFLFLILAAIAVVGIYAYSKFSKLGENIQSEQDKFEEDDIIVNDFVEEEVGTGFTNFVLFGGDSRDNDVDNNLNTDSIIVVCLNNETKEIKLLSVYRDTLLDMTNGSLQKCNSAYQRGGAKQAINMLNMNLDLDIQKYVTVNFSVVSDVIDMLGGIEVDVSEAEVKAVNKYLKETAKVAGKEAVFLTEAGLQSLDGVQATTYARIRKGVGNDYARTERQREIISLALQKAINADLSTINKMIDVVFPQIATNFTLTDVLKYAKDLTKYQIIESEGFPFDKGDGNVSGKGSCVYPITLASNVTKLHEFLYGTVDYQPSEKVCSISEAIDTLVFGPTPTTKPTQAVTPTPTAKPTQAVTPTPTAKPTQAVTPTPTAEPTQVVTPTPTAEPTQVVTPTPTAEPTQEESPASSEDNSPVEHTDDSAAPIGDSSNENTEDTSSTENDNSSIENNIDSSTENNISAEDNTIVEE